MFRLRASLIEATAIKQSYSLPLPVLLILWLICIYQPNNWGSSYVTFDSVYVLHQCQKNKDLVFKYVGGTWLRNVFIRIHSLLVCVHTEVLVCVLL